MKERPILFSGQMVREILAGKKTETRRIVKAPKWSTVEHAGVDFGCPYGAVGSRLWVRETWHTDEPDLERARAKHEDLMPCIPVIYYRADPVNSNAGCRWRPSIFMPRWASRITMEVVDVRVEKLQDISDASAMREGCYHGIPTDGGGVSYVGEFFQLWDSINAKRGFPAASNPYVWAIRFEVER